MANGKHDQLGGVRSSGEFGSMMLQHLRSRNRNGVRLGKLAHAAGKRMYAFAYHIDKEHGYSMEDDETHRTYTSAYKGLVYWDRDAQAIPRITLDTVGIPPDFPVREVHIQLDYDLIKIGEQEYMLPYHFRLTSVAPTRPIPATKPTTGCIASTAPRRRSPSAIPSGARTTTQRRARQK